MYTDAEHLDKKLEDLSLVENQLRQNVSDGYGNKRNASSNYGNIGYQYTEKPESSLLSSSLAGEKHFRRKETGMGGIYFGSNVDERLEEELELENTEYYSSKENATCDDFTDEHPEPELLASSVGKEIDGRLIPSSSTISLLSLNSYMNNELGTSPKAATVSMMSPKAVQTGFSVNNPQFFNQQLAYKDRKGSLTNIKSRNSLTHLNQKRLQTYHTLSSPSPMQSTDIQFLSNSTIQSIPINPKGAVNIPDSPSLDPTSLGGSPSRFWLSSQTPPTSIASSLKRNSRSQLYQLQQIQHTQPLFIPNDNNYTTSIRKKGDTSPLLIPVQTPLGDTPMTPLFLNSNNHNSNQVDSYFDISVNKEEYLATAEDDYMEDNEESLMIDA